MTQYISWGTAVASAVLSLVLGFVGMPGDATKVDLADLTDGETRTFGEGEELITATRDGDTVVISLGHDDALRTIDCKLNDESNCFVYSTADTGANVVLLKSGVGDLEQNIEIMSLAHGIHADGATVRVESLAGIGGNSIFVVGDGEHEGLAKIHLEQLGNDGETVWVTADGTTADVTADVIVERLGDSGEVQVIRLGDDTLTLRCPEGDTTMRLDNDEVVGSYFCPQHNVELKEVKHRALVRKVNVQTGDNVH